MAFTASAVWEVQTTGVDDFSVVSATVAAGGTGYSVGNTLTVTGGTSTTTATFTVATVSGGVVLTVTPLNTSHYTVVPANPVATTGGAGTCTLNITWNAGGNGGGFDAGVAGFPTDGAVTSATSAAPVFSSASYNFVAGDVGAWIYIKSGTSSIPGWYKIASVAANAATLNATIGAAVLAAGTPSTATGCGTATPLASATWGIDYSQGTAGNIAFTDMVVGATTTQFTSVANPVGKNFVGNIISVNSGATVQRVAVVSTSGTTATCDKTLGTAAQTGVGNLGGPLGSPGQASLLRIAGNTAWIKSGTYSVTSATTNIPQGCVSDAVGGTARTWEGYQTVRGDLGAFAVLQASGISSATLFAVTSGATAGYLIRGITVDGASLSTMTGMSLARANANLYKCKFINCTTGFTSSTTAFLAWCSASACGSGFAGSGAKQYQFCEATACTVVGFGGSGADIGEFCLAYSNTGSTTDGFANVASCWANCTAYGNGRHGFLIGGGTTGITNLINCLAESNGTAGTGYGFSGNATARPSCMLINCGGYLNSQGNIDTTNITLYPGFVTGSASFFIAPASGNLALNNTPGGGAAARAAGVPGAFLLGTTTGFQDMGAAHSRVPWQTTNLSGGLIG